MWQHWEYNFPQHNVEGGLQRPQLLGSRTLSLQTGLEIEGEMLCSKIFQDYIFYNVHQIHGILGNYVLVCLGERECEEGTKNSQWELCSFDSCFSKAHKDLPQGEEAENITISQRASTCESLAWGKDATHTPIKSPKAAFGKGSCSVSNRTCTRFPSRIWQYLPILFPEKLSH